VYSCKVESEDGSRIIFERSVEVKVRRKPVEVESETMDPLFEEDLPDDAEELLDREMSCKTVLMNRETNDDMNNINETINDNAVSRNDNQSYLCFDLGETGGKRMSHLYVSAAGASVTMNCNPKGK